ncbi:hypothetical protein D9M70_626260 [compost metagenome]
MSKKIEPRPMARSPASSKRVVVMPFRFIGTRKALMPLERSSGVPVRAKTTATSAWSAMEIEVFSPFST